jgi:hypothetical protein
MDTTIKAISTKELVRMITSGQLTGITPLRIASTPKELLIICNGKEYYTNNLNAALRSLQEEYKEEAVSIQVINCKKYQQYLTGK